MPLLDEVSDSFGVEPEVVLADAGYCNEADLVAGGARHRWLCGTGAEGKARVAVDPHTRAATHRMGEKLAREGQRQAQVDPRDRTAGSRRCWGSDGSACGAWTRCGANGTWCALPEHQASGGDGRVMRAVGRAVASGSAWRGCVMTRRVDPPSRIVRARLRARGQPRPRVMPTPPRPQARRSAQTPRESLHAGFELGVKHDIADRPGAALVRDTEEPAISASIRLLPRRPASGGQTTPRSRRVVQDSRTPSSNAMRCLFFAMPR